MNQKIKAGLAFLAAASVLVAPQTASAAGFYISEVGTPGSLGTAGVANPTNTFGPDSSVATSGGGDGGNAGSVLPVPSFFYVNKLSDRFRLGFSVAAIQGGGVDYGENFVGRYSVAKAELGAIGISPSIDPVCWWNRKISILNEGNTITVKPVA